MKKSICIIIACLSISLNIILLSKSYISNTLDNENNYAVFKSIADRDKTAKECVRQYVRNILYYPETYDPVFTRVDSTFYGPMTDCKCIKAAYEYIDFYFKLGDAEYRLKYADRYTSYRENKNNIKTQILDLKQKIEKRVNIIKNRDSSNDGKFIGWKITHRYRALNQDGIVVFSTDIFIVDPTMQTLYFRFSADERNNDNIDNLEKVISHSLGIYNEDED
ncbi:MAG: hypothetical protein HDR45_00505 [Bacteroides sp.]|nr:hypothetical protein [Bacteroides sp.]